MEKMRIGVVGCGNISDIYILNSKKYNNIEIVAVCDLVKEKAEAHAAKYEIPKAYSDYKEMMKDDEIDVILNLTIPKVHYEIGKCALLAGKHLYTEKPLTMTLEEGMELINLANEKNLRVGSATDTFLGSRIQTVRKLVDEGWIGKTIAGTAFMTCHGHESWHPAPQFYYKKGAGPMFDMGPYYLNTLLSILGPAKRISGSSAKLSQQRRITSEPSFGEMVDVEVPTHATGVIEFVSGAVITFIMSFEIWDSNLPRIEFYGTEGSVCIPDADPLAGPNVYSGPIYMKRADKCSWNHFDSMKPIREASEWDEIPNIFGYKSNERIVGLADMCDAIQNNRPHRASGDMALHAVEIMQGINEASESGMYYEMKTSFERPEAMPVNKPEYMF